ncbi:mas-related G-protein coupled receptor member A1-like isoform X2 [Anolis carolinensis]|uniref:mas-related G-protein coupled receptor member A1-like isoform X2 n=1 Tax=Anolis carolinensis TaxID=28377 RepID=UPI002F2B1E09
MRSVLSLNHTDKPQKYGGNYATCSDSYEKAHNKAEWFHEQLFSIAFLTKPNSTVQIIFILIIFISIVGMLGNGCVIWQLGFCLKRNNFTTYILNLATADFNMLMSAAALSAIMLITVSKENYVKAIQTFFGQLNMLTHCVGLYLMTAIGVERCLSILFPIWVHCHRPKHLSTTVSVLSWILSGLFNIIEFLLHYFCLTEAWVTFLRIISGVNLFIFIPVMVVSTLILFIKMSFRHQPGKLHTIMLIILLFFIVTAVPYSVLFFLCIIDYQFHVIAIPIYTLLNVVNSSINPIIYFFVGSRCNCKSWDSIKVVFHRVFKDETELTELRTHNNIMMK